MLENYFARPSTLHRLRGGPLGADLDELATALQLHGYAWDSIRNSVRGCDQFARWLSQHGYAPADVSQTLINRYISGLPRPPCGTLPKYAQGLSPLLTLWRQQQRLPERLEDPPRTAADHWLLRYEQYLDQVCGLAASTRQHYRRLARCFLVTCFGTGRVDWPSLHAHQIADFVRQATANKHGGGRRLPSTAVRSVLRFLVCSGDRAPGLEAAALAPRQWRHASLPHSVTAQEVEQVLALYAGPSPPAWRHRAIFTLFARRGLRAHEIVSLRLDDIHWQEAHLVMRAGKTHHERVFPVSQDVGAPLAEYLCWGRPATTSRALFLHCKAPFRPLSASSSISYLAARALVQLGVTRGARRGAHVLRHSAASRMVNGGASFTDVADVLGHQSLHTTGIYATLDLATLSDVARPWRGDAP